MENKDLLKKERKKLYDIAYREKNKDLIKEKEKLRRLNMSDEKRKAISEKKKEYSGKNKEKLKDYIKKYANENKDKLKARNKEYVRLNLEKTRAYQKEYRKNNKELIDVGKKRHYLNNKNNIIKKSVERFNFLYKNNIEFRIKSTLRRRLLTAVSKNFKKGSAISLLGCDMLFFKEYIENKFKDGMSWENHGKDSWHLDHIIPCAKFDLTDVEQQKICFHYTNFQPLWAFDNYSKGSKILKPIQIILPI